MKHITSIVGSTNAWQCKCTCPERSPVGSVSMVYEWEYIHLRNAHLTRPTKEPSLLDQRNYFQRMADNPSTPPEVREEWKKLADELSHRIGVPDEGDHPTLF